MQHLLRETARTARGLKGDPAVRAACVLGSVVRGEIDVHSDLDVLFVITPEAKDAGRRLRAAMPRRIEGRRVQIRLLTHERLEELAERRTVFAAHVAREGVSVFDNRGDLRRLKRAFPLGSSVAETGEALRRRLTLYEDLRWCNGHYLTCYADLFAFGRAAAILALAREGTFDFGRSSPLERYAKAAPAHDAAVDAIRALEPFYLRVRRRAEIPLPFAARDSHQEATEARDACATLLSAVP